MTPEEQKAIDARLYAELCAFCEREQPGSTPRVLTYQESREGPHYQVQACCKGHCKTTCFKCQKR